MSGPFGNAHGQLFDAQCGGLGSAWRRAALEELSERACQPELQTEAPQAPRLGALRWAVVAMVSVLLAGALPIWLTVPPADESLLDSAAGAPSQRV